MIHRLRGAGTYMLAALALLGYLAIAQTDRPTAAASALSKPVASAPAHVSCLPSSDAMASWLRSQGFPAQAAKNFARSGELDCASLAVSPPCVDTESAASLLAQGFSAQAIKNITRPTERDC
jgi:hypothetical protein